MGDSPEVRLLVITLDSFSDEAFLVALTGFKVRTSVSLLRPCETGYSIVHSGADRFGLQLGDQHWALSNEEELIARIIDQPVSLVKDFDEPRFVVELPSEATLDFILLDSNHSLLSDAFDRSRCRASLCGIILAGRPETIPSLELLWAVRRLVKTSALVVCVYTSAVPEIIGTDSWLTMLCQNFEPLLLDLEPYSSRYDDFKRSLIEQIATVKPKNNTFHIERLLSNVDADLRLRKSALLTEKVNLDRLIAERRVPDAKQIVWEDVQSEWEFEIRHLRAILYSELTELAKRGVPSSWFDVIDITCLHEQEDNEKSSKLTFTAEAIKGFYERYNQEIDDISHHVDSFLSGKITVAVSVMESALYKMTGVKCSFEKAWQRPIDCDEPLLAKRKELAVTIKSYRLRDAIAAGKAVMMQMMILPMLAMAASFLFDQTPSQPEALKAQQTQADAIKDPVQKLSSRTLPHSSQFLPAVRFILVLAFLGGTIHFLLTLRVRRQNAFELAKKELAKMSSEAFEQQFSKDMEALKRAGLDVITTVQRSGEKGMTAVRTEHERKSSQLVAIGVKRLETNLRHVEQVEVALQRCLGRKEV